MEAVLASELLSAYRKAIDMLLDYKGGAACVVNADGLGKTSAVIVVTGRDTEEIVAAVHAVMRYWDDHRQPEAKAEG